MAFGAPPCGYRKRPRETTPISPRAGAPSRVWANTSGGTRRCVSHVLRRRTRRWKKVRAEPREGRSLQIYLRRKVSERSGKRTTIEHRRSVKVFFANRRLRAIGSKSKPPACKRARSSRFPGGSPFPACPPLVLTVFGRGFQELYTVIGESSGLTGARGTIGCSRTSRRQALRHSAHLPHDARACHGSQSRCAVAPRTPANGLRLALGGTDITFGNRMRGAAHTTLRAVRQHIIHRVDDLRVELGPGVPAEFLERDCRTHR